MILILINRLWFSLDFSILGKNNIWFDITDWYKKNIIIGQVFGLYSRKAKVRISIKVFYNANSKSNVRFNCSDEIIHQQKVLNSNQTIETDKLHLEKQIDIVLLMATH